MKVLHLDDDQLIRKSVSRMLCGEHDVTSVATCEDAVALMQEDEFDLLLSDWQLSRGTAQMAIESALINSLPVLVMSSSMHEYLEKEVDGVSTMEKTDMLDLRSKLESFRRT